jgi:pimeloyl-ACP methyl ester carboxylesterase
MATDWDEHTKRGARVAFGRAEKVTWAAMRMMLKLFPTVVIKALLHDLTILDVDEVVKQMSPGDLDFIKRLIQTSRSGTGFMNDIEHHVDNLATITKPVLVMYSPNDKTVSPKNARRVADELPTSEPYEVPSDTHLIWIGKAAKDVWQKRLSFLRTQPGYAPEHPGFFHPDLPPYSRRPNNSMEPTRPDAA